MIPGARRSDIDVRVARVDDLDELSHVLGEAFHDDPVLGYVITKRPVATRAASIFRIFAQLHLADDSVYVAIDRGDDRIVGAAIWADPGSWRIPNSVYATQGLTLGRAVGLRGIARATRLIGLEHRHPRAPHHYLAVLGSHPAHRGRGIGSALMAPVLERCDDLGLPAYLESSKESNVPYYARHGFEVTETYPIKSGPTMYLMWREPQPPDQY